MFLAALFFGGLSLSVSLCRALISSDPCVLANEMARATLGLLLIANVLVRDAGIKMVVIDAAMILLALFVLRGSTQTKEPMIHE